MENMDERIINTNVEREFIGTTLTHDVLKAEGFRYKLDELEGDDLSKHPDPFYYYKGEFRIYDVMDDFYIRTPGVAGAGMRVQSLEALQEAYIDFMGRRYSKEEIPEDSEVPNYDDAHKALQGMQGEDYTKIKLIGGPGNGKTIIWPAFANAFVYQTSEVVGGRTIKHGFKYEKRKGRKTMYDYVGPTD